MKIILLIGRLCCGKTTYAQSLPGTLLLSSDELMQTMFPDGAGTEHDQYARRSHAYLFHLARQSARAGVTPVLDFGFWTPAMRRHAIEALEGFELDWRWLTISEEEWARRIARRNAAIQAGQGRPSDYFVDEGLLQKARSLFVDPTEEELPGMTIIPQRDS